MPKILQNELKKPGVYIDEVDNSLIPDVPNAPQNTTLFYGVSELGIPNKPVFIDSPRTFEKMFGKPNLKYGLKASHGTWTAYNYLASGLGGLFLFVS